MCIILYNNLQAEDFEAYLHRMPDDTQVVKQLSDTQTGSLGRSKGTIIKALFYEPGKQALPKPTTAKR